MKEKLGIAHRDLKPENILVKKSGSGLKNCQLMISDFDTVKITDQTSNNTVIGTLSYMVKIK